ncbi:uncharacterized protein MONOS_3102 [Monocercomonoides exilis]|uniref:uncharacterized protein n=1 Tax=Monocercomonoides exilis TaxID=2049356 RepID=UPI00355A4762|nr:hypothetical protein MONOS_3102 [Monocercomonoides exilis]|eukprot:MONOS_3102.1-p1 / transcript=MONOS_3102.1 / gene=MONOS_3102 / organism=Monocercomonoides_exilis_PA203 / gene_product=unspecified product / transcript_product=unspecified product / location=Mono_scaffold00070:15608-16931(+) / protein_length=187 / sequence_SO=supercontig / SO=protein_coding / is_pseudo=false
MNRILKSFCRASKKFPGERLDALLEILGLDSSSLPHELDELLTALATISLILDVKSPTISNLLIALCDLQSTFSEQEILVSAFQERSILVQEAFEEINTACNQLSIDLGFVEEGQLSHGTLVKQSQQLRQLKEQLAALSLELKSFQSLPPDTALAEQEIEKMRKLVEETNGVVQRAVESSLQLPSL